MATVTLAESAKLTQDMLVSGVIENVKTVNPIFDVLPFYEIEGNALGYNRENALGDAANYGVGDIITSKASATFTKITSTLTKIIGDAEVDGLIQATRSDITDQQATQIASKAKSCGRLFQDDFINGNSVINTKKMDGLLTLSTQSATTGANGKPLDFDVLDELHDLVLSKDGVVDFYMMSRRTIRSYYALLRALGGANISEVVDLPGGRTVPGYRGVPIFANDWIPTNQSKGTGSNQTTILAGNFDDGSQRVGIAGLTARGSAGIRIEDLGISEHRDERVTRVKWYCGLALFSSLALATADGITN